MNGSNVVKLSYFLAEDWRKAQFVETGRMPSSVQTVDLDMAQATPQERAAILRMLDKMELRWTYAGFPEYHGAPSIARVAADCARLAEAREAAERQTAEKELKVARGWIAQHLESHDPSNNYTSINRDKMLQLGLDLSEYNRLYDAYQAARTAFFAEREAARQAEQRRLEERAAQARREAEEREAEKRRWIEQRGSEFLKRACLEHGYDCQRRYVTERAALEAPGFVVDFDDAAQWKSRACPSEAALDLLERMKEAGLGEVEVVWLTGPVRPDEEDAFEPCEAVAVSGYLGKYDLVRPVE